MRGANHQVPFEISVCMGYVTRSRRTRRSCIEKRFLNCELLQMLCFVAIAVAMHYLMQQVSGKHRINRVYHFRYIRLKRGWSDWCVICHGLVDRRFQNVRWFGASSRYVFTQLSWGEDRDNSMKCIFYCGTNNLGVQLVHVRKTFGLH